MGRSDALAQSLLAPLSDAQRDRLVAAMEVVERLLSAGLVEVDIESPSSAAARFCIASYFSELDTRFDTGFDPSRSISADVAELTEPVGLVRLETNKTLREAMGLYRSAGYVEVDAFNDEPSAQHWFEKRLEPQM